MKTIGLLGGSFDPVHNGHLALAQAFAHALNLDELRFMPAGQPWQKSRLIANDAQRLDMLQLALNTIEPDTCDYSIDTRELQRQGATYTIDTLAELRTELGPEVALVLLIGADQLQHLDTWKNWQDLWRYAHIAAATRSGSALLQASIAVQQAWQQRLSAAPILHDSACGKAWLLENFAVDISATAIRAELVQIKQEESSDSAPLSATPASTLLPRPVLDYIRSHQLY